MKFDKVYIKFSFALLISTQLIWAQYDDSTFDIKPEKYREDQFYIGLSYSVSLDMPDNSYQNNLSYGIDIGFLRDIPLNELCNRAVAIGIGYSTISNYSNLLAQKVDGKIHYSVIEEDFSYERNKLEVHSIDVPLELRWRTSTYDTYNFWRVYLGMRFSYLFVRMSKLVAPSSYSFNNTDINPWRSTIYLAFNFKGRWNIFAEYSLSKMFKSNPRVDVSNQVIDTRLLNLGIRFYIL